jgi:hypothetical protein
MVKSRCAAAALSRRWPSSPTSSQYDSGPAGMPTEIAFAASLGAFARSQRVAATMSGVITWVAGAGMILKLPVSASARVAAPSASQRKRPSTTDD